MTIKYGSKSQILDNVPQGKKERKSSLISGTLSPLLTLNVNLGKSHHLDFFPYIGLKINLDHSRS